MTPEVRILFGVEVDTTDFADCVDATEVRTNNGQTRTCAQIFERNPAACAGRMGAQCPVTCGFCESEDSTTEMPKETTMIEPSDEPDCEARLEPSEDCPRFWESLSSDCNAIEIGERCEPEQSFPELGMTDWDIDNCGICKNSFPIIFLD